MLWWVSGECTGERCGDECSDGCSVGCRDGIIVILVDKGVVMCVVVSVEEGVVVG